MGKITKRKNIKLVPAYALMAVSFLVASMFIADYEREYIEHRQYRVASNYTDQVEAFNDYKVWDKQGNEYQMSEADSRKIQRLDFFAYIFPHMAYILSALIASLVYYRVKLKKPLHILTDAAVRIADNDLDFVISYEKDDELGQLCDAFEKMRYCLEENNRETWRQMEARKRLNASFSHDLRTPLTVLEGHLDILQKYALDGSLEQADIEEIYSVMNIQLRRMSRYVSCMSELQRLEDIPISPRQISTEELIKALKNIADIICATKQLSFTNDIKVDTVIVDLEIVLQVFENLLSNAMRYAKSKISVVCRTKGKKLLITVEDDGKGFSQNAIKIATDPFYTTEKKSEGEHFGLGLNISKILCQRHGGCIVLKNQRSGGASISVSFGMKSSK